MNENLFLRLTQKHPVVVCMEFLITGGMGFIGFNIAKRLINDGHEVIVLDDMSLGKEAELRSAKTIRGDVRNKELIDSLCKDLNGVFHDAARSSSPMFSPDPKEGMDVNLKGFLNVADAARRHDFPVVYATTSSLYSRCPPPHRESLPVSPGSFYEYSFYARELAATIYTELYGLKLVGLRYFSVYGPHEEHKGKYANNITQFLWAMMKGKSPVIYGDGTQTRDFTYVDDVVGANILAMRSNLKGEVLNVGTGKATSFNEIVAILNKRLGLKITPTYVPNPIKNYVMYTQADTSKAERVLGFRAKIKLEEGIEKTINYYTRKDTRIPI